MFLTARIFGIFTYIVCLVIALLGVRYLPPRQTKYVVWGYLVVLCLIALCYIPYITTDVYRHNQLAAALAQMPLDNFLYILSTAKSGLFTFIYFRIFEGYLMPVTCAIVFGSMFFILLTSAKQIQCTRSIIFLVLLWIMTNDFYLISITNIRSYVAVAFVTFCMYRETFEHKFNLFNVILYLCAIEMHSMGIVLVAFRTLAYLFSGGKLSVWKMLLVPLIIMLLIVGLPFYQDLLIGSTNKFESYYTGNSYNYIWERVIFIIQTIVQVFILYKAYAYRLFKEHNFANYKTAVTWAVIVLLICHLHVTFMQRWIMVSAILEIPLLMCLLKKEQELHRHQIKQFLIVSCLITFAFVCTRGNLCSLKFWE